MGRLITHAVAVILLVGGMAVANSNWNVTSRVKKPVTETRGPTVNPRDALRTPDWHREFDPPSASVLGRFDQFGGFIPFRPNSRPRSAEEKR
jgi:hypothetical protein